MNGGVSDVMVSRGKRVEDGVKLRAVEMPAGRERQGAGHRPPGEPEKGRRHVQSLLFGKCPPRPSTDSLLWCEISGIQRASLGRKLRGTS